MKLDAFHKNIIFVFLGTSLVNFFNLLYQLIIAHRLIPADFAAFNSLLSIFMLVATPFGTLQTAIAKYASEFSAQGQIEKIKSLFSVVFKKTAMAAFLAFFIFLVLSFPLTQKLKIHSFSCGYILAALISFSCIAPVFMGGLQGLELFGWLMSAALTSGALKLILTVIFVGLGFNIAGALGALLVSILSGILIGAIKLREFFSGVNVQEYTNFKEILFYLFPVAVCLFCFTVLVSFDMVLVRYFFSPKQSGLYSLAQMVGKIFLFLPGAISVVMFPRTSGLSAKNMDTLDVLKRSLKYSAILCLIAVFGYNIFPLITLKILTGKAFSEVVALGRFFAVSMSFFSLLYVMIMYFLSVKDLRFIKYLVIFTLLQLLAILLFHNNLTQVQLVLCVNAFMLFFVHLLLAFVKRTVSFKGNGPDFLTTQNYD